jgi:hypothetical protein
MSSGPKQLWTLGDTEENSTDDLQEIMERSNENIERDLKEASKEYLAHEEYIALVLLT